MKAVAVRQAEVKQHCVERLHSPEVVCLVCPAGGIDTPPGDGEPGLHRPTQDVVVLDE